MGEVFLIMARWGNDAYVSRTLRSEDPLAIALTAALKQGEVEQLVRLLAADPALTVCVVESPKGGGRTPLHVFADWPGRNPNAAAIVRTLAAAGADLNAQAIGMWHRETPLHWAASNDDVVLRAPTLSAGARRSMAVRLYPLPSVMGNGRQRDGWLNVVPEP